MITSIHQYRRLGAQDYTLWLLEVNNVKIDTKSVPQADSIHLAHSILADHLQIEEVVVEEIVEKFDPDTATPSENPFPESVQQYDSWTIKELKAECKIRELPVYGTKAELGLRLKQDDTPSDTNASKAPVVEPTAADDLLDAPTEEEVAVTEGEDLNEQPTSDTKQEPAIEE